MALFIGTAAESVLGLNSYAVAGGLMLSGSVLPYLQKEGLKGVAMMAVSPDVTAIAGYAGDHKGELFTTMLMGMEAANHLTIQPNVKDQTPLIQLKVTKGLRPYNSKKQMESGLEYKNRILKTGLGKKELVIDVQKYRNTYLSKYLGASAHDRKIPFAEFTAEEIVKEFGDEINSDVIYFGLDKSRFSAFSGSATYAVGDLVTHNDSEGNISYWIVLEATTAGQTPLTHAAKFEKINGRAVADGLQIHINEAIDDGDLVEVTVGEIDNDTVHAIDAVKKVYRTLPKAYRRGVCFAYMSFDQFDLLEDDMDEKQKYTVTDPSTDRVLENAQYVPGTGRKLIAQACGWMGDSERIICTPKENIIVGTDLLSDANQIKVNPNLWEDEMGLLFNVGINFAVPEAMAINDRD